MSLILTKNEVHKIEEVIEVELLQGGADHVIMIDMSGNLLLERGSLRVDDIMSLAVLSAANFAATAQIAKLIGEEDFSLLFHKGDKRNIHFSRLGKGHLMITLFNDNISLGLIRLKSNNVAQKLMPLLDGLEGKERWRS